MSQKKKMTNILKLHYIKLFYRSALFLAALIAYIIYYPESSSLLYLGAHEQPWILAVIWIVLILEMILLIKWEITYHLHPERFSTQTNDSLSCAMCEEKLCQHKTQLKSLWKKYGRQGG